MAKVNTVFVSREHGPVIINEADLDVNDTVVDADGNQIEYDYPLGSFVEQKEEDEKVIKKLGTQWYILDGDGNPASVGFKTKKAAEAELNG